MPDKIRFDVDILNMRFEYSDMDTVSDVKYPDLIQTDLNLNGFGLEYDQKIFVPFSSLVLKHWVWAE
jgi:hypothetical protein